MNDFTKSILEKRVIDICAVTPKNISVYLNSKLIKLKNFTEYISLYIGDKNTVPE